jgi:hypothetical protein
MDAASFATAYGLSASVGLRPFLTLALAALAIHFGYLHASPAFARLGSDGAAVMFGGLAVVEFAGDKIPAVDHVLHVLHFAIKPLAAAILVGGTIGGASPEPVPFDVAAMVVAGLSALGIHAGVTALRGASSAATLGFANPLVSLGEDVTSIAATLLAILVPFAGAFLGLAIGIVAFAIVVALTRELRRRRSVAPTS